MARDWSVPVNSLLVKIQDAGFTIRAVFDGEETIEIDESQSKLAIRKAATDVVVSVDVSHVYVRNNNRDYVLFLFLDENPEEILSDYTENPLIESVCDDFISQWEGKKCPVVK
jgi:hypothetical protein